MKLHLKESKKLKTRVVKNHKNTIYSANIRRMKDAYFHTSKGYRCVDVAISTILIESTKGTTELIAGKSMMDAVNLIFKIVDEKIAFEDLASFIEINCNYKAIDEGVERTLNFFEKIKTKEITSK